MLRYCFEFYEMNHKIQKGSDRGDKNDYIWIRVCDEHQKHFLVEWLPGMKEIEKKRDLNILTIVQFSGVTGGKAVERI